MTSVLHRHAVFLIVIAACSRKPSVAREIAQENEGATPQPGASTAPADAGRPPEQPAPPTLVPEKEGATLPTKQQMITSSQRYRGDTYVGDIFCARPEKTGGNFEAWCAWPGEEGYGYDGLVELRMAKPLAQKLADEENRFKIPSDVSCPMNVHQACDLLLQKVRIRHVGVDDSVLGDFPLFRLLGFVGADAGADAAKSEDKPRDRDIGGEDCCTRFLAEFNRQKRACGQGPVQTDCSRVAQRSCSERRLRRCIASMGRLPICSLTPAAFQGHACEQAFLLVIRSGL